MSVGNRMTLAVLRSPLHPLMSRALMGLSYQGRRTGTTYELPLQYVELEDHVVVWAGDGESKTWWRNFQHPRPVTVTLRGKRRRGTASLVDDVDEKVEIVRGYLRRYPYTSADARPRFLGPRWRPTDDELERAAKAAILVRVDL